MEIITNSKNYKKFPTCELTTLFSYTSLAEKNPRFASDFFDILPKITGPWDFSNMTDFRFCKNSHS